MVCSLCSFLLGIEQQTPSCIWAMGTYKTLFLGVISHILRASNRSHEKNETSKTHEKGSHRFGLGCSCG